MTVKHILITSVDRSNGVPRLSDADYTFTTDGLDSHESQEYFCGRGHAFTLLFSELFSARQVPFMWECPACETIAPSCPAEEIPANKRFVPLDLTKPQGL